MLKLLIYVIGDKGGQTSPYAYKSNHQYHTLFFLDPDFGRAWPPWPSSFRPPGKYLSAAYLVPSFESSVFRCCPSVKDGLDVDGHVTVGRTETSNDGETQTLLTTSELDNCAAKDKTWLQ